jgi:hypothetical protein
MSTFSKSALALVALLALGGLARSDGINNPGGGASGSGSVTSVSVTTANGVSGTVANPTSTPAISVILSAITPSSVAIGAGSAITSSGPGGALGAYAYQSAITSQVVNGTYNLTTASGTQSLTFGFTPSSCEGFGTVSPSATDIYTTLNAHADSAATQAALFYAGTSLTFSAGIFFYAADSTGGNVQDAVLSYAANAVTLSWTKTGTPTGTFSYSVRCFR